VKVIFNGRRSDRRWLHGGGARPGAWRDGTSYRWTCGLWLS